jgi:asparagine synthase (glutamine-hydrolysing)
MSTFFGIYDRLGRPVRPQIAANMFACLTRWHPDSSRIYQKESLVLGHAQLRNTPESGSERLPAQLAHLVLVMDARLDNRKELHGLLNMQARKLDCIPDSELLLHAYLKWGTQCPKYLLGDFSFVLWDCRQHRFFCARDHAGIRQFYYSLSAGLFLCANDLQVLSRYPGIGRDINDTAVADFLAHGELVGADLTFFQGISKLPPGHSLTVGPDLVRHDCYWKPEESPRVILPDAESYSEKLRELLEQAVRDRLRSSFAVVSHLSGGLDSSSIAVIAARELANRNTKLAVFNWIRQPTQQDDADRHEWANSKKIAAAEAMEHHFVSLTAEEIFSWMQQRNIIFGNSARFWSEYPIRAMAQSRGARTILSGWGGDELISYHGSACYMDFFLHGNLFLLLKELWAGHQGDRKRLKRFFLRIYHHLVLPTAPERLYRFLPEANRPDKPANPLVCKEFLPQVEAEMKKSRRSVRLSGRSVRSHMLAGWYNNHLQSRIESWATAGINHCLEYGYPLLDKRILEFALGIPAHLFLHKGTGRFIYRKAITGLLPEELIRMNKYLETNRVNHLTLLIHLACKKFAEKEDFFSEHSRYIDVEQLRNMLQHLEYRENDPEFLFRLHHVDSALALLCSLRKEKEDIYG